MRSAWAIAAREFASFFRVPLGWVVIALFVCLSAIFFVGRALVPGSAASMREFFTVWWGLLLFVAPAISMRLFSEELRTGTLETVLTAPVPESQLVAGKYLASVMFLAVMLAPTLAFVGVLQWLTRVDLGPIFAGYLGLLLLGMLYLSVGALASALTSSQTLAFLGSLFALLLFDLVASRLASQAPEPLNRLLFSLSPSLRLIDFARGLVDTAHIAFFLAASFWFLALTVLVLQSRRWR